MLEFSLQNEESQISGYLSSYISYYEQMLTDMTTFTPAIVPIIEQNIIDTSFFETINDMILLQTTCSASFQTLSYLEETTLIE